MKQLKKIIPYEALVFITTICVIFAYITIVDNTKLYNEKSFICSEIYSLKNDYRTYELKDTGLDIIDIIQKNKESGYSDEVLEKINFMDRVCIKGVYWE